MLRAGTLHKLIPEATIGTARVVHDTPDALTRMRAAMHGQALSTATYTRLFVGDELWMTDADFECRTNAAFVRAATGDVLIAGLGLGLVLTPLLKSYKVESVTVLERSRDVIDMIGPLYKHMKLSIIEADARTWEVPKRGFDYVYLDIWANVPNEDNREEIKALKKKYRSGLRKGGKVQAWCEEYAKR